MFKKILLPLDLSDRHERAVAIAADLAQQAGGQVILLHIIEIIPGLPMEEEKTFYGRLEQMAQKHLDGIGAGLGERKVTWRRQVVFGHRAKEVAEQAAAQSADLIVLTAPQIEPGNPSGWGSLSWKIGVLAKCPVLLVK